MSSILLPLVRDESTISLPLLGHVYIYVNENNKVCIKSDTGSVQVLDFDATGIIDHISTPLNSTTVPTPIKSGSIILVSSLPRYQDIQTLVNLPITFRTVDTSTGEYFDTTYYRNGLSMSDKSISSKRIKYSKSSEFTKLPTSATEQEDINTAIDVTLKDLSDKLSTLDTNSRLSLAYDPSTTTISIKDGSGHEITSLSLLPLLNKIDIRYNPSTKSLQIYDDSGNKLDDDIPLTDLISGVITSASWGARGVLNFLTSDGITLFSVTHTVNDIQGLPEKFIDIQQNYIQLQQLINRLSSDFVITNSNISNLNREISTLRGIQVSYNSATKTLELKDGMSRLMTSVSLQALDDEGTDLRYNSALKEIELYNSAGVKIDGIPLSDFVSEFITTIEANGTKINLKDSSGKIISSAEIKVSTVQGLQDKLNAKVDVPTLTPGVIPAWGTSGLELSNLSNTTTGVSLTGGITFPITTSFDTNDAFSGLYLSTNRLLLKKSPSLSYSLSGLGMDRRIDPIKSGYRFEFLEDSQMTRVLDTTLDLLEPVTFAPGSMKDIVRTPDDQDPINGLYPYMPTAGALFKFKSRAESGSKTWGMFLGQNGKLYIKGTFPTQYSGQTLPPSATQNLDTWYSWNTVLEYNPSTGVYIGDDDTNGSPVEQHSILRFKNDIQKGAFLSPQMTQATLSSLSMQINNDTKYNGMVVYVTDVHSYMQYKNGNWNILGSDSSLYGTDGTIQSDRIVSMNGSLEFKTNGNSYKISGLKSVTTTEDLDKFSAVIRQNPATKELATGSAIELILTHPDTVTVQNGISNNIITINNTIITANVQMTSAELKQYKKIMKKILTYSFTPITDYTFTKVMPSHDDVFAFEQVDTPLGKLALINTTSKNTNAKTVDYTKNIILNTLQVGGEYPVQDGMIFKFTINNFNNRNNYNDFVVENEQGDRTLLFNLGTGNIYIYSVFTFTTTNRINDSGSVQVIIYYYNKKFFMTAIGNGGKEYKHQVVPVLNLGTKFKFKFLTKSCTVDTQQVFGITGSYMTIPASDLTVLEASKDFDTLIDEFDGKVTLTKMNKTQFTITKEYPGSPDQIVLTENSITVTPNVTKAGIPNKVIYETLKSTVNLPANKNWMIKFTVTFTNPLQSQHTAWRMGVGTGLIPEIAVFCPATTHGGYLQFNNSTVVSNFGGAVDIIYKKIGNSLFYTYNTKNQAINQTDRYTIPDTLLSKHINFNFIFNTEPGLVQFIISNPEYYIEP